MLRFHTCSLFLDFIKWYFVSLFRYIKKIKLFRTCPQWILTVILSFNGLKRPVPFCFWRVSSAWTYWFTLFLSRYIFLVFGERTEGQMANCSLIRYLTNRQDWVRFFFSQKCIRPSASNNQYLAGSRIGLRK